MSLQMVTVTGTLKHLDGTPQVGRLEFALPYTLVDTAGHVLWSDSSVPAELDNGAFTVDLPATDSAGVSPTNWTYTVTIATDGNSDAPFQCLLPSTPDTAHLDQLVRADVPPTVGVWVPVSTLGTTVAQLGTDGKVLPGQLPAGSGGNAVASVTPANGTILVTGTAADPALAVGSITEAQVSGLGTDLTNIAASASAAAGAASAAQSTANSAGTAAAAAQSTANAAATSAAAAYVKPGPGIPKTDLAASVQTSLGKADTALQVAPAPEDAVRYGCHSRNVPLHAVTKKSTINNECWFARILVRANTPIVSMSVFRTALAAALGAGGLNSMALYADAGGAPIAISATDDTMWVATGQVTKTLAGVPTPTVDTWYLAGVSARGYSTAAEFAFVDLVDAGALSDIGGLSRYKGGGFTSWPATLNPGTDLATGGGFVLPIYLG